MNSSPETQKITNLEKIRMTEVREVMDIVFDALKQKGYSPINQIVGYILSGDPTYITGFNNARYMISKIERDELLEEIVKFYIKRQDD